MPPSDQSPPDAKGRRGRKPAAAAGEASSSGLRVMAAFRIPKPLHGAITDAARAQGSDLTSYVNRTLDGYTHLFDLPSVVRESLEADEKELGFDRFDYLQYVLFRRYEGVVKNGPGFDRTGGKKGK